MGDLLSCDDGTMIVAVASNLIRIAAAIDSKRVSMLLDSGASHNFLSLELVGKLGIDVAPAAAISVRLADGSELTTSGVVTVPVRFAEALQLNIEFHVLQFGLDCVLGMPFL